MHTVRIEMSTIRVVRSTKLSLVERRRPVVADGGKLVGIEVTEIAIPCSGEKNRITIGLTRYPITVYAVLRCPSPRAVLYQFFPLGISGHTPCATPVHVSGIVPGVQSGFLVGKAAVATLSIVAVFGEFATIGILVGCPHVVVLFWGDFAPCVVAS